MTRNDQELRRLARASLPAPTIDVRDAVLQAIQQHPANAFGPMERIFLLEAFAAVGVASLLVAGALTAWEALNSPMNAVLGAMQASL